MDKMMKYWMIKGIKKGILITLGVLFFTYLVMYLWNWLMPGITGVSSITFIQAMGLLILCRLLFGSFHGCGGHHHHYGSWRNKVREKYNNMSPEEKMKFREKFGRYCHEYHEQNEQVARPDDEKKVP